MRFKSVIASFIFVLLASSLATIVFIQTKSFGNLVTKVVTDITEKKLQTKIRIHDVSLSAFPPGIELNQIIVEKKISDAEGIDLELGKVGFYLNLIEFEEKKFNLGEIRVLDSYIKYIFPKKEEELSEIDPKLIDKIFTITDSSPIPIDTLILENSKIIANHELLEIRRLKILKKDDSYLARFHIGNIRPQEDADLQIDEIWGDAELTKTDIRIERVKVQHDVQTVIVKGIINNYPKLKKSNFKLNGELQVHLENLNQDVKLPESIQINTGIAKSTFDLEYSNDVMSGNAEIVVENFKSNVLHTDELKTQIKLLDEKVIVSSFEISSKNQYAELLKPVEVYRISNKTFLKKPIYASVKNFPLNNALRILGPSFESLQGNLNGEITFEYKDGDMFFTPRDNFVVSPLGLVVGGKKDSFTILMIKKALFRKSSFSVVNKEFKMNADIQLAKSRLTVDGFVNNKLVKFHIPKTKIDLEDFGNISKLDIKGAGELSIDVSGSPSATEINLKGNTSGFEILGYKLDQTEKDITVDLGNSLVTIAKMESKIGKTTLSGNGTVNYGNSEIALGITSPDANFADLSVILHPILSGMDFLPPDLDFKSKVDVDIFGKTKLDDLKIRSKMSFSNLTAYGEALQSGSIDIVLMNRILSFNNLFADKDEGSLRGDFSLNLIDKKMKFDYQWENIDLGKINTVKKINLNLESTLAGKIKGSGSISDYLIQLETFAFNTKSGNYRFEDSHIKMKATPNRITGEANLLGKIIQANYNLALNSNIASDLKLSIKTNEIKPLLVAGLGPHLETEEISGGINFEANSTFQNGFNNLNLTATLKKFAFIHPDFKIEYESKRPDFVVRDGSIELWDLNIKDKDLFFRSKGEGVFGKKVSLIHDFHFNSKLLEIFLAPILSAEGELQNIIRINGNRSNFDFAISSTAADLDLSIDQLPVSINDLSYNIEFSNNELVIRKLVSSLNNGSVSLEGDIFLDREYPDINLKFILDKAEIPILGKSYMNLSGEGIILGNSLPYNLSGELTVNKAQIYNELNEFSSKSGGFSNVRFLPKNQESPLGKLLTLNLNVIVENPVRITNSLMDIALKGEVRLSGNPSRPRGEGRLMAPVASSRIFFKNSEYLITSADLNFSPKKEISNPDFDIQALTIISNYKVYPKAYGDLSRFNFDLTSEPPLPRNSILSLIAFGYTNEIQSSLQSKDQQSLTQVGVGSFVFDRFKISDILNKQFGLQVNLGTVIEQSSTDSLLTGRTQEGQFGQGGGAVGRTRSATKIELKKRLDEALTLSVSSTMGGSIGQRQSMNLNYGINKNVQLEGVYELRTNQFGESDIIFNSIGGDVKFRGTFK